jgi:hypothetical protein
VDQAPLVAQAEVEHAGFMLHMQLHLLKLLDM